ncbi:MAG TPA: hypothetical protein VNN72_06150, partial [Polyangiaceae bacterium]|nr:hypothetical protein [Polyangiaceae bacterium]
MRQRGLMLGLARVVSCSARVVGLLVLLGFVLVAGLALARPGGGQHYSGGSHTSHSSASHSNSSSGSSRSSSSSSSSRSSSS